MPYVKSIPIHTTVNRSLAYILNPDKTDDLLYTAALNCSLDAKDAYLAMKMVFENFSDEKYDAPKPLSGKGSVKAIHYIQSFSPDEKITPEQAHRIGKAFARKTFGDDCQIVIATHLDKGHLHNHFILNSYSVTGRKFNDNMTTVKQIRQLSDEVCLAFGIQPITKNKDCGKSKTYNEWENAKRGTSWKQQIKSDIDRLIGTVKDVDELLYEMELLGYEIKKGKYISIKAPEQQRFVRTKTLGEDYTAESLASRILWHDTGALMSLNDNEPSQLREAYQRILNGVMRLAQDNKKVQRKRFSAQPYSADNDLDVYKLSAQLTIINRDHLHSIGELEGKISRLKSEYKNAVQEMNRLTVSADRLNSLAEQADTYLKLSEKGELTAAEQLKMNICRQTLENNNIHSTSDMANLTALQQETNKKIAVLKIQFENCKRVYDVYSDIAKTYYDISTGDYIARLAAEEKERRDRSLRKSKASSI